MWDNDLYFKTLTFAAEAHKAQKFPRTELPYLVHLTNVCSEVLNALCVQPLNLDINLAMQVALLHDVIEDTKYSYSDINKMFGKKVANGVMALTKNADLPKKKQMVDSLHRILEQPIEIRIVKMADRISNLQKPPMHWTTDKIKHYHNEALLIYNYLKNEHINIENRLLKKIKDYEVYF